MSRTRILQTQIKMENNIMNNNLTSLLGLNACSLDDTGACFQYLVNKSFGNRKQYICNEIDDFSEINNSLLNSLDVIDSNIKNESNNLNFCIKNDDNTYTLDDLLDLGNEELNETSLFDGSLDDDTIFCETAENGLLTTNLLLETAMASPLSSSSEESCDLDDILFMDEVSPTTISNENAVIEEFPLELQSQETETGLIDLQCAMDVTNGTDLTTGTDLSALCSLLFQNQAITVPLPQEEETSDAESNLTATSETKSEKGRYKPYKKPKTTEQKLRKKSQNRTAATRYRVKKKDELSLMSDEADQMEEQNKQLRGKVDGLRTEIDYLKNLMLDVIKARLAKGTLPENLLSAVMAN